jgi:hypothetical protein
MDITGIILTIRILLFISRLPFKEDSKTHNGHEKKNGQVRRWGFLFPITFY